MQLLADWVHNLSPFALRITDSFGLRWYGMAYLAGFLIAWATLKALARRGALAIPEHRVSDLMLWLIVGVLAGGRLGYILVYQPSLLVSFDAGFPFWGVFRINQGGMASHGGLVGVIIAAAGFARAQRVPALHILDTLALVAPVGLMLGRIANFINGELLGRIVAAHDQPTPWWSVRYPQELLERRASLPDFTPAEVDKLDELIVRADVTLSGAPGGAFGPEADALVQRVASQPGRLSDDAAGLLIDAIQRGESRLANELAPLLTARHPSQLYQAFAEGPLVLAGVWACWLLGGRSPGKAGGVFMITYGIGRIATEFYRLPDAHLTIARFLGLSRGQWLSVGMIIVGVVVFTLAARGLTRHIPPSPPDASPDATPPATPPADQR